MTDDDFDHERGSAALMITMSKRFAHSDGRPVFVFKDGDDWHIAASAPAWPVAYFIVAPDGAVAVVPFGSDR